MDGGAGNAADLPTDDRNLVVRAARLLQTRMSEQGAEPRGADVELVKRIPWQSGLGGASSDAAATLDGLNRLWGCGLAAAELHSLAAQLGSDVNFFLDSQPAALCQGRGELVTPLSLHRRLPLVLLQPAGGLSTATVFSQWRPGSESTPVEQIVEWLAKTDRASRGVALYNELESVAARLHPGVAASLEALRREVDGPVVMSGSGSCCFGICRSWREALRAAMRLGSVTGHWARAVMSGV
jgi:4-diphosphocytidyl-2-C-methyl-D-erythritol kinase